MSVLELRDVDKHYGGPPVVQGVSLSVDAGETVALIGPNGAGKTTLFSVMAGEASPDAGSVHLFGRDVTRTGARRLARDGVARTFQVARFFPTLSVERNVVLAADAVVGRHRRFWAGPSRAGDDVDRALAAVGLQEHRTTTGAALSQGDRKNLELAMALVQRPRLLLLDEPTAGMGAEDLPRTIGILRDLRRERPELAVVVTAHDMDVVFALADRVVLMAGGRVVLDDRPEVVRAAPQTRETYLGTAGGGRA